MLFKGSLTTCGGSESKVQYLLSKSKHSSIPRKNCFVSRSVCKLRNSCPSRVGSRQIYHLMQRIIKALQRHIFVFFVISRTMTSQGRSENSDQSGPLHPMSPNADPVSLFKHSSRQSVGTRLRSLDFLRVRDCGRTIYIGYIIETRPLQIVLYRGVSILAKIQLFHDFKLSTPLQMSFMTV